MPKFPNRARNLNLDPGKAQNAGGKQPKAKAKSNKKSGRWWSELEGDDVISLEPLAELDYEPFMLPPDSEHSAQQKGVDSYSYFDGKVLSRFWV